MGCGVESLCETSFLMKSFKIISIYYFRYVNIPRTVGTVGREVLLFIKRT